MFRMNRSSFLHFLFMLINFETCLIRSCGGFNRRKGEKGQGKGNTVQNDEHSRIYMRFESEKAKFLKPFKTKTKIFAERGKRCINQIYKILEMFAFNLYSLPPPFVHPLNSLPSRLPKTLRSTRE